MFENERIARAAGFDTREYDFSVDGRGGFRRSMPDWRTDPGAVATWLLPVLEKRWPNMSMARMQGSSIIPTGWVFWCDEIQSAKNQITTREPTFHEAIIAAVLATGEGR